MGINSNKKTVSVVGSKSVLHRTFRARDFRRYTIIPSDDVTIAAVRSNNRIPHARYNKRVEHRRIAYTRAAVRTTNRADPCPKILFRVGVFYALDFFFPRDREKKHHYPSALCVSYKTADGVFVILAQV